MYVKILKLLFTNLLYKKAVQYVQSTENEYDDKALKFLNDFINSL